jgi:hypothetical protein
VKLTTLAVIAILVLGCGAANAQSYAFGFLNYTGGLEYCNYEQFFTGGANNFYMSGFDNLTPCSSSVLATIEGEAITVPAAALESNGLQKGIQGKGYIYADMIIDAYSGFYTGEQWMVNTKTKVNVKNKPNKWNWDGLLGFSGLEFIGNYGFLTTTIPSGDMASHGATIGHLGNVRQVRNLKATTK